MTYDEHLQWCKDRANQYVDAGELTNALASMVSDLRKHPELEDHAAIGLGVLLKMAGHLDTAEEMRKFINGFN
jgi:hypothetical protein